MPPIQIDFSIFAVMLTTFHNMAAGRSVESFELFGSGMVFVVCWMCMGRYAFFISVSFSFKWKTSCCSSLIFMHFFLTFNSFFFVCVYFEIRAFFRLDTFHCSNLKAIEKVIFTTFNGTFFEYKEKLIGMKIVSRRVKFDAMWQCISFHNQDQRICGLT